MQIKGILHSYLVPNVDDHIHEYGSGSNRVMSLKAEKQKQRGRNKVGIFPKSWFGFFISIYNVGYGTLLKPQFDLLFKDHIIL